MAILIAVVLACTPNHNSASHHNGASAVVRSGLPVIVIGGQETTGWVQLLRASGLGVRAGTLAELAGRTAAVVAGDADLTAAQESQVRAWVVGGGALVTPEAPLLVRLGWKRSDSQPVVAARMTGLAQVAAWPSPLAVSPLAGATGTVTVVARAAIMSVGQAAPSVTSSGPPRVTVGPTLRASSYLTAVPGDGVALAATAGDGAGNVLALAVDPFAGRLSGYELLPELGRMVASATGAPPGPTRAAAEVYLDPGGLHGALEGAPEQLAAYLSDARVVQLAGWDFCAPTSALQPPCPKNQGYDYGALITALHRRGILVYAWLEPPFVNQYLWDSHPECREKTVSGQDAIVDWRHLIALEDPQCMDLAWGQWHDLLSRYHWDGVNVADLYFGPIDTPDATPFHPSALRQFGNVPAADREGFMRFRQDMVVRLDDEMLRQLNGLPRAAELEFELTVLDDHVDPAAGSAVGSDVTRLAGVAARNGASLQVDNPTIPGAPGPLGADRLSADTAPAKGFVEVMVTARSAARPTPAMATAEQDLAFLLAARRSGRAGAFSAGTIGPQDMAGLAGALAGAATTLDTGIRAPWSVTVQSPRGTVDDRLVVDGVQWPAGRGVAVVPAGEHQLQWSSGTPAGPGLLRLSGELSSASVAAGEVGLAYDSRPVVLAVVTRRPSEVRVDGVDVSPDVVSSDANGTVVRLPPGTHRVTLRFS